MVKNKNQRQGFQLIFLKGASLWLLFLAVTKDDCCSLSRELWPSPLPWACSLTVRLTHFNFHYCLFSCRSHLFSLCCGPLGTQCGPLGSQCGPLGFPRQNHRSSLEDSSPSGCGLQWTLRWAPGLMLDSLDH